MKIELRQVPAPTFSFPQEDIPLIPKAEYERRLKTLYETAGCDWVAVYGDREHFANLAFLVNYDPRFEEGLLLLGPGESLYLLVGNEGLGYTPIVPVAVQVVLCQTFSLPGQQRDTAPRLLDLLQVAGIKAGERIGVVGWKYLEADETDDTVTPAFVPAFLVDTLRRLAGREGVVLDVTAAMLHPEKGLRARNTADQIAAFEWAARTCSAAVFNVLRYARPGLSEGEAINHINFTGAPFTMHPIMVSGKGEVLGLRSAGARRLEYGDAVSTAVGYWGSLCCRAGMLLGEVDDNFFQKIVEPYYRVIATWYRNISIGAKGGDIFRAVSEAFAGSSLRSALNPGHLTSLDEWLHSPIRPGSSEQIASGMVFQADIIPTPLPTGYLLNCEDTLAIGDAALRADIQAKFPAVWQRIESRRRLMREGLGLQLADEILPLSDGAAYLPPFWLAPDLVCSIAHW
ncbi:MAG: hypothetical protein BroJett011_75860 [Chloroflexota bacterium]|nr:MAG: hypothetical protein BroJett011_75860 [Chloroflexota bacterium]